MASRTHWTVQLAAFRSFYGLTQEQVAERLGVTPPTVSRWESGKQVPDTDTRARIQALAGTAELTTRSHWVFRVTNAVGTELLLEPGGKIIAASEDALQQAKKTREELLGMTLESLLPGGGDLSRRAYAPFGHKGLQETGVFAGAAKGLRMTVDRAVDGQILTRNVAVWPVLTLDHGLLCHMIGTPNAAAPEDIRVDGLALRNFVLYKEQQRPGPRRK